VMYQQMQSSFGGAPMAYASSASFSYSAPSPSPVSSSRSSSIMASAGPPPSLPSPASSAVALPSPPRAVAAAPKPLPQPAAPNVSSPKVAEQNISTKSPGSISLTDDDLDYTKIPTVLDKKFEMLDDDSALRPTILKPGNTWTKSSQKALLADPTVETLSTDQQGKERSKAFDLLDALSRSGDLPIDHASLHIVLASTHCFDKTLMNTVIQDNVNPIEKVERSILIVATTIHDKPAEELVKSEQLERVQTYSPKLFILPPASVPAIEASSSEYQVLTSSTGEKS